MTSLYLDSEIGPNKLVNSRNFALAASIGIHGLLLAGVIPNIARSSEDPAPRDLKNVGVIELNQFERSRLPDLNPSPSTPPGSSEIPGLPPVPGADNSISALPDLPPLGSLDRDLPPLSSISPPPSLPPVSSTPSLPALPPNYSSLPSSSSLPIRISPNPARLNGRSIDIPRPPRIPSPPSVPSYPPNFRPPSVPTVPGNNSYANNFPADNIPADNYNYSRNNPDDFSRYNPNLPRSNRRPNFDPSGDPSLTAEGIRQSPIRASEQAQRQLEKPVAYNPATGNESPLDNQRAREITREWEEQRRLTREDKTNTSEWEAAKNYAAILAETAKNNPEVLNQQLNRQDGDKPLKQNKQFIRGTYPLFACSRQLAGTAIYAVTVNGAGNPVSEPRLIKSAGYPIFNQQAAREVRSTNFSATGASRLYQVYVSFAPTEDVCRGSIARPSGNDSNPIETRNSAPPAPEVPSPIPERARPTIPRPNPEVNPRPENPEKAPAPIAPPETVDRPKPPQPAPPAEQPKPPQPAPAAEQPKPPQPAPPVEATKTPEPEGPPAPAATTPTVEPAPEPPKSADPPADAKPEPAPSPGSEG